MHRLTPTLPNALRGVGLVAIVSAGVLSALATTPACSNPTNPGCFEAPLILTTGLPDASVGLPYEALLVAGGGDGFYVWSIESGSLPDGLELSATGAISGTPTQAEEQTFRVQVISAGIENERTLTLTVVEPPPSR